MLTQDGSGDEWALAANRHFPHFLKLTWIYEVPIGPGKSIDVDGVLGQIVGGWTITGIHNYRSGNTLSVFDGRINGAGYPFRPDVVSGVDQVNYDGSSVDIVNGTQYLNRAAFATQPLSAQGIPSRIGTAPPILDVRGPALYTEDLGFLKRFGVGDRNVEFRLDILNLFNRSGLGGPNTDLSSPNFGQDLRRRPRRAAVAGVAQGDFLGTESCQLPTPNYQSQGNRSNMGRKSVQPLLSVFPLVRVASLGELEVGSWELIWSFPRDPCRRCGARPAGR